MSLGSEPKTRKRLAYLVNHYPLVSHTFIRSEILELERMGFEIHRMSIRPSPDELVDASDIEEDARTSKMLGKGSGGRLLISTILTLLSHPIGFARAIKMAGRLCKQGDKSFLYHLIYLAEACYLLRWSVKNQISHIHVHFGTNGATVALLCKKLGGPSYSLTIHGAEEFDGPRQYCLRDKVADASFVVAISSFCSAQITRWANQDDWDRIHIVHCTVNDNFFEQASLIQPTSNTIVCVGRIVAQKGYHVLIDAFAEARQRGVGLELVLVGDGDSMINDGDYRGMREIQIHELGLDDCVTITGWKSGEEIRDLLLASRGFIMSSFAEGLPVVIMEAMALGRPAITTGVAGIPELVEHGVNGWLVPVGRQEELAEAIVELAGMTVDELNVYGDRCRAAAQANHHGPTEVKKLAALFEAYV